MNHDNLASLDTYLVVDVAGGRLLITRIPGDPLVTCQQEHSMRGRGIATPPRRITSSRIFKKLRMMVAISSGTRAGRWSPNWLPLVELRDSVNIIPSDVQINPYSILHMNTGPNVCGMSCSSRQKTLLEPCGVSLLCGSQCEEIVHQE